MPNLTGKTREEVVKILDDLKLKYNFNGNGIVVNQKPKAGSEIDENITVEVEFSDIKE